MEEPRAGGLAVTQNRTYESMQVNATNRTCLHCTSKTQVSTHMYQSAWRWKAILVYTADVLTLTHRK